jgi:hypothetical protein
MFELLEAYHAGTLPRPQAEAVEQHLLACDECRADFRFQRTLRQQVAALPRELPAPGQVWEGIRTRIGPGRSGTAAPASRWQQPRMLAAAAVLLVAVTAALTAMFLRSPAAPTRHADFQVTQAAYVQAAEELARTLEARREGMSPAAIAVVEQNLRIIDEAIRETQAALAGDPGNEHVAELLWGSWEKKIDLLKRAAQHAES